MTREDRLRFCATCTKRQFDPKKGIVCSLTSEWADFETACIHYNIDYSIKAEEAKRLLEKRSQNGPIAESSALKKKGILEVITGAILLVGGLTVLIINASIGSAPHLIIVGSFQLIIGLIIITKGFGKIEKSKEF